MKKNKFKKIIKIISLVMVVLVAFGMMGMSVFMGLQVSDGLTKQNIGNDTKSNSVKQLLVWGYDTSNFDSVYEKNSFYIKGDGGYDIPVVILGGQTLEEKNTVILIHGLGGDYVSVYPQAEFYLKNNYNVITYDQRGGGDSSDENIYFGYYEKEDLKSVVNYVRTHISDQKLVVHGFSLGAVTAGLYSATEHAASNVDVLVMDSAFDSMEHVFLDIWPEMNTGLPGEYAVWCGNIALKLQYHFGFKDNDLTLKMGSCTIPTLLIQGEKDNLSTPEMGENIFDVLTVSKKEIWYVNSEHIKGYIDDPVSYEHKVMGFIDEITAVSEQN